MTFNGGPWPTNPDDRRPAVVSKLLDQTLGRLQALCRATISHDQVSGARRCRRRVGRGSRSVPRSPGWSMRPPLLCAPIAPVRLVLLDHDRLVAPRAARRAHSPPQLDVEFRSSGVGRRLGRHDRGSGCGGAVQRAVVASVVRGSRAGLTARLGRRGLGAGCDPGAAGRGAASGGEVRSAAGGRCCRRTDDSAGAGVGRTRAVTSARRRSRAGGGRSFTWWPGVVHSGCGR